MKKQHGFTWWKLALLIGVTGLLYFGVGWVNQELEEMQQEAFDAGHRKALLAVAQRDNEQLVAVQKELERLRAVLAAREKEHFDTMVALDALHTKEVRDVEARKERFVSDVTAGRIRLYDPGRKADNCSPERRDGETPKAVAAGGLGDGAGGAELSPALAGFLGSEAGRADKVVIKLTAAQGVIREYLKTCNAD